MAGLTPMGMFWHGNADYEAVYAAVEGIVALTAPGRQREWTEDERLFSEDAVDTAIALMQLAVNLQNRRPLLPPRLRERVAARMEWLRHLAEVYSFQQLTERVVLKLPQPVDQSPIDN